MSKSSFTVYYKLAHGPFVTVLGVTSIVPRVKPPNLNGILFQTENGEGHQVEAYQMNIVKGSSIVAGLSIEYSTEADIRECLEMAQSVDNSTKYIVIDGRE